jgi:Cu(I)/Ag(I) efflux system membrane protein CusA/SilA
VLNRLIQWALAHRLQTLGLALVVLGLGTQAALHSKIDVFPDLNKPTVTVLTEGHGLASEEVEQLVTVPIEAALNGVPGLTRLRSQSGVGLSVVWAEFAWDADIWRVRQLVAERLGGVRGQLPPEADPLLAPVSSIMGEIQWIGLAAEEGALAPMDLRSYAEWTLRPRLLGVPGVSQVIVLGGGLKQLQIRLKAAEVNRRQLDWGALRQKLEAIGQNSSGGFLDQDGQEYLVRNLARPEDLDEVALSVVGQWLGRPVLLRDVADVAYGPAPSRGTAGLNGKPGVILTVLKSPEADTLHVTRQVEALLKDAQATAPKGLLVEAGIFKQADFIQAAVSNVAKALAEGGVLMMLVLLLFLGSLRVSGIAMTAIPLSFLASVFVLRQLDMGINTMTLGGLAIACGEMVDDAIVDVENIFRRLKQARAKAQLGAAQALKVVFNASVEVRGSIVLATSIVVLAFLPMLALDGMEGRLFQPLGIAYITSILCSLLVSLTVTPVLSSYLLGPSQALARHGDSKLLAWLKAKQEGNLRRVLPRPRLVLGVALGLVLLALAGFVAKGKEFLPPFNESTNTILLSAPPGISLAESDAIGAEAERLILGIPEVAHVSRRTGRAENDEHAEGVNRSEIDVAYRTGLKGARPRGAVVAEIREKLEEAFPNASLVVGAPIAHRVEHMLSGVPAALALKLYGDDLTQLRLTAAQVLKALEGSPGLADLSVEQQVLIPELRVRLDREALARARLSAGETAEALELALGGAKVGTFVDGSRRLDMVARVGEGERADIGAIEDARLATLPDGRWVRVGDVAEVYETHGPNQVLREGLRRRIVVQANVEGASLSSTVEQLRQRLKGFPLPEGYELRIEGQYAQQEAGQRRILLLGLLSFLLVAGLLWTHYRNVWLTGQILLNIPLALVGSVAALYLAGGNISLASLVAFITLCGIASRNGILMISHYLHLMREEGEKFGAPMVIRGSLERLGPVLMTASVAILAMTPFLLAPDAPGREILYPVALVVVGGLISSTLLDLFVTPTLFLALGSRYLNTNPQGGDHAKAPAQRPGAGARVKRRTASR